jgi:hypothetical protein
MSLPYCAEETMAGETALPADDEPQIRVDKVLDIRRQLGEGRYRIGDCLDVVIDRIRDLG